MAVKKRMLPTGPRLGGGAPIFTPEQFSQVRPGGSYAAYKKFITTRRGITSGPAYPGRGGPGLDTYMSLLKGLPPMETPAQLEARAKRMVDQQIAAQKGLIVDETKRANEDAIKRMQAMSAAGRAAASLNAGLFGRVGGAYNAGAQEIAGLATNLAGGAGAQTAADVANINTALGAVGAPGVEATGAMAGPGQVAVEAYRGGTLPAQNMQTQGQASQFGLAGMVAAQNLRATQEAQAGLMQSQQEVGDTRADAMREIARGRPGLASEALEKLQASQRQQVALAMSLIGARRGALQTGFEQKVTTKKLNQSIKESNAQIEADKKKVEAANKQIEADAKAAGIEYARIDSAASRVAGYLIDKAGRPILTKDGRPIPVAKSARAGGAKGLTANQAQRQIEKAQSLAETLFYGYATDENGKRVPANELGTFDPDNAETYGTGRSTWYDAMRRIKQLKVPHAQAVQILSQFYERGDQGRPMLSNPERTRIIQQMVKKNQGLLSGPPTPGRKMNRKRAVQELNSVVGSIIQAFNAGNMQEGERLLSQLEAFLQ